jgi:hypothetical protein
MSAYKVISEEGLEYDGQLLAKDHVLDLAPEDEFTIASLASNKIALEETAPEAELQAPVPDNEEHTSVTGEGSISETGVISQSPFSVTATWKEGVSPEEQEAALAFIKTVSEEANTEPYPMPESIVAVTVTRI